MPACRHVGKANENNLGTVVREKNHIYFFLWSFHLPAPRRICWPHHSNLICWSNAKWYDLRRAHVLPVIADFRTVPLTGFQGINWREVVSLVCGLRGIREKGALRQPRDTRTLFLCYYCVLLCYMVTFHRTVIHSPVSQCIWQYNFLLLDLNCSVILSVKYRSRGRKIEQYCPLSASYRTISTLWDVQRRADIPGMQAFFGPWTWR